MRLRLSWPGVLAVAPCLVSVLKDELPASTRFILFLEPRLGGLVGFLASSAKAFDSGRVFAHREIGPGGRPRVLVKLVFCAGPGWELARETRGGGSAGISGASTATSPGVPRDVAGPTVGLAPAAYCGDGEETAPTAHRSFFSGRPKADRSADVVVFLGRLISGPGAPLHSSINTELLDLHQFTTLRPKAHFDRVALLDLHQLTAPGSILHLAWPTSVTLA